VLIVDKKLDPNLFSLVVVEGGPKAIKFYKNLMLKRIKWDTFIKKVVLFKCLERDRTAGWTQTRRNRGQEVPEQLPSSLGGTFI
jgi:hypothetical protein